MTRDEILRARLADKTADVLAYRGSELYAQFVQWLGCVEECYREELLTVDVEHLRYKQGAAAQVRAMMDSLLDPSRVGFNELPKV